MRNHFFLILVLASLLAFVQKFADGELSLLAQAERAPASLVIQHSIETEPSDSLSSQ